jgi:thiol:disulfide interchange protein DsbD
MKKLLLLVLLALAPLAQAADKEPLPPDQVYKTSASAAPGTISVHWDILPGYYLYKSKFKFVSHVTGIRIGTPAFPAGEIEEDPYFGKQEIYRKGVTVTLPYTGVGKLDLELVYQGCAEAGFCYPPQHKHINIDVVAPPAAAPAATSAIHPPSLEAIAGNSADTGDINSFPPPDQAFRFSAVAKDQKTLELRWQVTPGFYLYRQKFDLKSDNPDVQLGTPDFPQGTIENDPYFGTSEIYKQDVDVLVPLTVTNGATQFKLTAVYQGCAEAGFCYPPITKTFGIDLAAAAPLTPSAAANAPPVAEQNRLVDLLKNGSLLVVMLTFLGVGVLLTFTPCVLPMIPIISGIIVGQGKKLSTARAFSLSLVYVLAMALAYAIVGVVVGLLGANIQLALQNPYVLSVFSLIFVLLALSMFGLYDLQMPSAVQSWLTKHSNSQQSGAYIGVAVMGLLSALICGPCITAPLVAALVFIGETGSALRGGLALFGLGLGMGVPLLIVGTSAGRFLPRAGAWMNAVKHVFGVVMLGLAIWFMSRVIPGALTLALWASLAIVSGIYLGALEPLHVHAPHTGWRTLWKGLGILALLYGLIMMVGAATGGDDPFQPLARFARLTGEFSDASTKVGDDVVKGERLPLPFKRIKSVADLDRELAAAGGKPVMLDFAADWCVACKELDHDTYTDPTVQAALKGAVLLQADVTANDDDDKALYSRFGIFGPPSVMFFGRDGKELTAYRVVGFLGPADFLKRVQAVMAATQ